MTTLLMTSLGEDDADAHHGHGGVHLAESPLVMVAPMVVLGVGSSGYWLHNQSAVDKFPRLCRCTG